ncbi:MAG: pentapeptide repeat-containing protein [Nostoc sp.]
MPQDFSGQNLRGRSFKGQNLEGANFSYADIRSADFTTANLRGANFGHAQAGLQKRWAIFLVCVSWVLSGISGLFSGLTGGLIAYIFDISSLENQIAGWTALIVVIVIFIVILRQGLNSDIAVAFAIPLAFAGVFGFTFALAAALAVVFALAGTVGGALAAALAIVFAFAGADTLVLAGFLAGTFAFAFIFAFALAVPGILFSTNIGRRAMKGDEKYSLICNIAVAFAAFGGTSFRSCDLTDANFTLATLKSTDFRKANLTRTCLNKTKKLFRG